MNENNNQQKEDQSKTGPPRAEKEFFSREEVKTMEKDVSKLRETEAGHERERLAQIKTGEEIAREKQRQEQAKQAALGRTQAEKEAKEREERVKTLRTEREAREETLESQEIKQEESKTAELRSALQEAQIREVEERKRFLARVEAKAESNETPVPPPALAPVAPPEIPQTFKKPSFRQKLLVRVLLSLLVIAVLGLIATFLYWYLVIRETPEGRQEPAAEVEKELIVPPAPFYVENSRTVKIAEPSEISSSLAEILEKKIDQGIVNRVLFENTADNEIVGLKNFFNSLAISSPEGFFDKLENDFTLFVYSQEEGNRLGLVAKIKDEDGLAATLSLWEPAMETDTANLFAMLGKQEPALSPVFKDGERQETAFRFQTFSREDLGIVYALYNDYFILTTSWKSMEKALDRLKEASLSYFFTPSSKEGGEFVLENMALQEKIGQLFLIGINGTALTEETEDLIKSVRPGGILLLKKNIENAEQTKKLIRDLQNAALSAYGIPLFIGADQEGGAISSVGFSREKTAQSAISNAEQAFAIGLARGEELKSLGINLNLAPVLDRAQDGDFLFSRVFQNNQEPNALAKALILGQKEASILTAVKHFPGYGNIAFNPEDELAVLENLPEFSLFKQASKARPEFVMTSNVVYAEIDPVLPFSFSKTGIALLKGVFGTAPLVITDDLPQPSLIDNFSLKGVVTMPIAAGADVLTFSKNWETTLQEAVDILENAVNDGEISQARINNSVLKIIKLKMSYYE